MAQDVHSIAPSQVVGKTTEAKCQRMSLIASFFEIISKNGKLTHSMPSINGVSGQSFSGNRCNIIPLRFPDPKNNFVCHAISTNSFELH